MKKDFETSDNKIQNSQTITVENLTQETEIELPKIRGKKVIFDFKGGDISSDAGLLLLKQTEEKNGIISSIEKTIRDDRDQRYINHSIMDLLKQRIFQISGGYEDGNDSDMLKNDPVFKLLLDRLPETGEPLASQPTISRFENSINRPNLYRIACSFVDNFISQYSEEPEVIVLDFDDTEDIVHGNQQLSFFNAHADDYCYLPLHIYEGLSGRLITTILKPGKQLKGIMVKSILKRLIKHLRAHWKNTIIIYRGDSHFTYCEVLEWIKDQENLYFVTGLGTNSVLHSKAEQTIETAMKKMQQEQRKVKLYHSFYYQAKSWAQAERVILKVEANPAEKKPNVRFIVTNCYNDKAKVLYEDVYCKRGVCELYIKDHKTYLKSDRTSCTSFAANQFRLFLHSASYVLIHALRSFCLRSTEFATATMQTIQLKLFKIGARIKELKTKIKIELPNSFTQKQSLVNIFTVLLC